MIFYFSGTDNSQWVAQQVAAKIEDTAQNISKLTVPPNICEEQYLGFVFPIYAWGVPEPMLAFVKSLQKSDAFTFGICTCGADAGIALKKFAKHYPLDSSYSVIMPSNYIVGSDIEDENIILSKLTKAKEEIQIIAAEITTKKKVYRVDEGSMAAIKTNLAHWGFNRFARTTKPFRVNDCCNGCGLCAKNCPAETIHLIDGKPTWNDKCYQCLRCINQCPQAAIQYGKATETRGRYTIQKYL